MSQFEKKQFSISRIERTLDISIEGWTDFYKSFDRFTESIILANRRERNPLVAGCGVIIPILFGLASIEIINTEELQLYLMVDITVAVIIYLGYGIWNLYLTKSFQNPENAIIQSITNLNALRHSFAIVTSDIEKLSEDKLDLYLLLAVLSDNSNKIRIREGLQKIIKHRLKADEVRKLLEDVIKDWDVGINSSVEAYKEVKDELDKEEWKNYHFLFKEIKESNK